MILNFGSKLVRGIRMQELRAEVGNSGRKVERVATNSTSMSMIEIDSKSRGIP